MALKAYSDKEATILITKAKFPERVKAGDSATVYIYIKNIGNNECIGIIPSANPKDNQLKIEPSRIESLKPNRIAEIKLTWSPDVVRETALNVEINIDYFEVIEAEP